MQSDNNSKVLLYSCRNCNFSVNAKPEENMAPCVYKNDLLTVARWVPLWSLCRDAELTISREQPGETKDLETDPTLQRSNIQCPKCQNHGCVP